MNVKHRELVIKSNQFLRENYGMELDIPIVYNNRLKSTLGRFIFRGGRKSEKIEMSVEFMKIYPKEAIFDVLLHELVHYAFCELGKPFTDGHPVFEKELKRLDISPTLTYSARYGKLHKYVCKNCGSVYERKRKMPRTVYCSCSIDSDLQYVGEIEKTYEQAVSSMSK